MKVKKKRTTALIVGSGAIGAYLSKLLIQKNFKVLVSSRMLKNYKKNYKKLKIDKKVNFLKLNILKKQQIRKIIINKKLNYIFYFAGQGSVAKSFSKPLETYTSNYLGAKYFLDVIKKNNFPIKFFKANSAYIFNGNRSKITLKSTLIKPESPYTRSQIKAYKLIKEYRKLGLSCYSIIFFNIESPLRTNDFLVKKICFESKKIVTNKSSKIRVGNINSRRDFGWAPEIVRAVYLMTKLKPCDMLIGTGKSILIKNIIKYAFKYRKLNYKNFVEVDKKLYRKNERYKVVGSLSQTFKKLKKWNWKPKIYGKKLVYKMCQYC